MSASIGAPQATGASHLRRTVLLGLLLTYCIAPLVVVSYLGLHSRPMSDDYNRIPKALLMPPWEYVRYWYYRVDASYSDKFVVSLLGPLGFKVVRLFPALVIAGWTASTALLIRMFLKRLAFKGNRPVIALALASIAVAAISQALYTENALFWYASSVKYSFSVIALNAFLIVLLGGAYWRPGGYWRALLALASGILCFLIAGFAETFAIVLLAGLGASLGAMLLLRDSAMLRRWGFSLASGCLGAGVSLYVMYQAPSLDYRFYMEKLWNPESVDQTRMDILLGTAKTSIEIISDPAVFAGFMTLLAAGLCLSLNANIPASKETRSPVQPFRYALLMLLAAQLLFLPFFWLLSPADASLSDHFSPAHAMIMLINIALIVIPALMLWRRERVLSAPAGRELNVPAIALTALLLTFALTQVRGVTALAEAYLWLCGHCALGILALVLSSHLTKAETQRFACVFGVMYITSWMGIAAAAFLGHYITGAGVPRTFTFAAHLGVWQGLAWGVFLGYAMRRVKRIADSRELELLRVGSGLLALAIFSGFLWARLGQAPKYQTYAREFDEREKRVIALRQAGERHITVAPLTFDLERYLNVSPFHVDTYPQRYYDVDDIVELDS